VPAIVIGQLILFVISSVWLVAEYIFLLMLRILLQALSKGLLYAVALYDFALCLQSKVVR